MNDEVRDVREVIREEMLMRDKIVNILRNGSRTVPEIAQILGHPSYEVMYWVMGMRKYGYVSEIGEVTDEGYHKYKAVEKEGN
ncbi:MAG: transcriptional regulator [Peptococcaceae bacterium BRH_c4a]|nr:MAG: transcriptional regulator [Peptococcaceae bacterium BRH_c4a]